MNDKSKLEARIAKCEAVLDHRAAHFWERARATFYEDTNRYSWENDAQYIDRLHAQWENRYKQTLHIKDPCASTTEGRPPCFLPCSSPSKLKWWHPDEAAFMKALFLFFGKIYMGFCTIVLTTGFIYLACGGK